MFKYILGLHNVDMKNIRNSEVKKEETEKKLMIVAIMISSLLIGFCIWFVCKAYDRQICIAYACMQGIGVLLGISINRFYREVIKNNKNKSRGYKATS